MVHSGSWKPSVFQRFSDTRRAFAEFCSDSGSLRACGNSAGKFPYVRTTQMLSFVPFNVRTGTLWGSSRTSARLRKGVSGDPCQERIPAVNSSRTCHQSVAKLSKFGSGQKQHLWFSPHPLTERPR